MSSTEIVRCFYIKLDENTYVCKCKAKLTQRKNTGFTNLKAHVLSAHKDYEAQIVTSPTSNIVERLFILTRLTFTDYRKATLPENLESTLYLKVNGDLWDIQTIANIMNNN